MEPGDDRSLPPFPEDTPGPTINTVPSFTGVDASSSYRSHRRSRSSRASERESLEEEIRRTVKSLRAQVDAERRRADNAERKVREVTAHLKAVNIARLEALRDAGRAKEELRLYKIQLDTAQREINRAQDVIGVVDKQRYTAEKEAARNRSKARQLQETLLMQSAREEAYRLGMQEGLDRGRAIAYAERPLTPYEDEDEYSFDDSRTSSQSERRSYAEAPRPRSMVAPSRNSRQSMAESRPRASPPPIPVPLPPDILPVNPPPPSRAPSNYAPSVRAPSNYVPSVRAPSTYAPSVRPESTRAPSPNPPLSVRAPSVRPESTRGPSPQPPSMRAPSTRAPSPNPAPSVRAPSTHAPSIHLSERMGRPVSVRSVTPTPRHPSVVVPPDNLIPTLDADMRIRLPPPHEFNAPHTPERAPSPALPAMSDSSHTSVEPLPIPPRGHVRAQSQQSGGRHRRNSSSGSSALSQLDLGGGPFVAGLRTPMSIIEEVNSQTASPHPQESMRHQRSFSENSTQQPGATRSYYEGDAQSMRRPQSRSSYAGSWMQPQMQSQAQDDQRSYNSGEAPNISVQPPSLSNKTDSLRGGGSQRAPSPAHGMPGGHTDYYQPPPPSEPSTIAPLRYEPRHPALQGGGAWRQSQYGDEDAASPAPTMDTLRTPQERYQPVIPESGATW